MRTWIFLLGMLALYVFGACKKDDNDKPGVTFDIDTPAESVTYQYNQVVQIRATINGPNLMHGYRGTVVDKVSGATILQFEEPDHGKSMVISKAFTNKVTANAACELTLEAKLDDAGNYARSGVRKFDLLKQ